jgi:hypothetical protein
MFSALTLLLAAATPPIGTLAGVALGAPALDVVAKHPEARRAPGGSNSTWAWRRKEGGSVTIFLDVKGIIVKIDFTADQNEQGSVDLPCASAFDVQGSHVNLQMAADPSLCKIAGADVGTYTLTDGSTLRVRFGPGDGQLLEAVWYRPTEPFPTATAQPHTVPPN